MGRQPPGSAAERPYLHASLRLGEGALRTEQDIAAVRAPAAHLSPAGQLQVATALDMLTALEVCLEAWCGTSCWTPPGT
jgi:hypothetical protein